jgi:hypothetical protein
MDAFLALPRETTRRGAAKPMVENNVVQSHVAQSEARWRSARYFLHAAADEALETIEERGEMDPDQRVRIRLASTGPFSRRARSSTPCITIAAQWRCSRKTRSNDGCETSTRSRNKARGGYCTTKRSVRSFLAYRPRTSSDVGRGMPVASVSSLPTQRRNYVAACQADARCERSVMMPFLDGNHSASAAIVRRGACWRKSS